MAVEHDPGVRGVDVTVDAAFVNGILWNLLNVAIALRLSRGRRRGLHAPAGPITSLTR